MSSAPDQSQRRSGLANILKNLGWLLGGKGFGAVCSLVYLAVLSRSLGIRDFGHFSLIFGTGQALVAIASFQSWQTMVKFGAPSVHAADWNRFGRLAWLCGSIDVLGAVVGCGIAAVVYYGFGEILDLNPAYVDMAFAFNCALLWARMTTPNGIVRVLDRFDIGTYVEAVVPVGRLLASFVIITLGATVGRFLFAWALFDLLAAALYWYAAWRLVPDALHRGNFVQPRETLREEPELRRFFLVTYASSTFDAMFKQGPLLAVGFFLGTSAAGLYRLADQLAQGIGKLSTLIARAVFPEFTMARLAQDHGEFERMVRRVTLMAGLGGLVVALVAWLLGEPALRLIGGEEFVGGAAILLPVAIGASLELAAVAYEPLMYATGHARYAMLVRLASLAVLSAAILLLNSYGPVGVGWAVALGMAFFYAAMGLIVMAIMRRARRDPVQ